MEDGIINKSDSELKEIWRDKENTKYSKEFIDAVHQEILNRVPKSLKVNGHFFDYFIWDKNGKFEKKSRTILAWVWILDLILLGVHLFEAKFFAAFEGKADAYFFYFLWVFVAFALLSFVFFRTRSIFFFMVLLPLLTVFLVVLCGLGLFAFVQPG